MGSEQFTGKITANISRNNSEKDIRHDSLWLDFINVIKYIAANPKYKEINLQIDAREE